MVSINAAKELLGDVYSCIVDEALNAKKSTVKQTTRTDGNFDSKGIFHTNKTQDRNEMCKCGSGLKYKHCCGK